MRSSTCAGESNAHSNPRSGATAWKLLEHAPFVVAMGKVNRAARVHPETRFNGEPQPTLATPGRHVMTFAGRLTDGPDHAEISGSSATGLARTIEDGDSMPAAPRPTTHGPTRRFLLQPHPLPSEPRFFHEPFQCGRRFACTGASACHGSGVSTLRLRELGAPSPMAIAVDPRSSKRRGDDPRSSFAPLQVEVSTTTATRARGR